MDTEILQVNKMRVNPGDTVVITIPDYMTLETAQTIYDNFLHHLPDGVGIILIPPDVKVNILDCSSADFTPSTSNEIRSFIRELALPPNEYSELSKRR